MPGPSGWAFVDDEPPLAPKTLGGGWSFVDEPPPAPPPLNVAPPLSVDVPPPPPKPDFVGPRVPAPSRPPVLATPTPGKEFAPPSYQIGLPPPPPKGPLIMSTQRIPLNDPSYAREPTYDEARAMAAKDVGDAVDRNFDFLVGPFGIHKGAIKSAAQMAADPTSAAILAGTAGLGAVPGVGARMLEVGLSAYFATQAGKSFISKVPEVARAVKAGDWQGAAEAGGGALADAVMAYGAGTHMARGAEALPAEMNRPRVPRAPQPNAPGMAEDPKRAAMVANMMRVIDPNSGATPHERDLASRVLHDRYGINLDGRETGTGFTMPGDSEFGFVNPYPPSEWKNRDAGPAAAPPAPAGPRDPSTFQLGPGQDASAPPPPEVAPEPYDPRYTGAGFSMPGDGDTGITMPYGDSAPPAPPRQQAQPRTPDMYTGSGFSMPGDSDTGITMPYGDEPGAPPAEAPPAPAPQPPSAAAPGGDPLHDFVRDQFGFDPTGPSDPTGPGPAAETDTNVNEYAKARKTWFDATTKLAVKYQEEHPGVSHEQAFAAVNGQAGLEPQEKDFQSPRPEPEPVEPPEPPQPTKVERPSEHTPVRPTAATMTEPEHPDTLAIQVQQLAEGTRKAVMFPGGAGIPDQFPPGVDIRRTSDGMGNLYAFRGDMTDSGAIKNAAKNNKLPELLGHSTLGMGTEDKSVLDIAGHPQLAVVVRDANGVEVQSTLTNVEHLDRTLAASRALMPPGGSVNAMTPEEAIAARKAPPQRAPLVTPPPVTPAAPAASTPEPTPIPEPVPAPPAPERLLSYRRALSAAKELGIDTSKFDLKTIEGRKDLAKAITALRQAKAKTPEPAPAPEPTPPPPTENKPSDLTALQAKADGFVNAVFQRLVSGGSLGNVTELNKLAQEHFGADRTSGAYTPRDVFDAMEAGINKYLLRMGKFLWEENVPDALGTLRNVMARVTTQATRTQDQIDNQQFSTPPTISFLANKVAGIKPDDVFLESSAGNGGLAVWAKAIGADVHVNEIDPFRQHMLELLGFGTPTAHDGEVINSLLTTDVHPTVMVINPPFSASTLKSHEAKNTNTYGFNHVESALQRLQPGGRLVAILGGGKANEPTGGASFEGVKSGKWFQKLRELYNIRANVRINGKEYAKYGTTFAVRLIVIDKNGPTDWSKIVTGNTDTLEEAYGLLRGVAETRPVAERYTGPVAGSRRGAGSGKSGTGVAPAPGPGDSGDRRPGAGSPADSGSGGVAGVDGRNNGSDEQVSTGGGADAVPGSEPDVRPGGHPAGESAGGAGSGAPHDTERPIAPAKKTREQIIEEGKRRIAEQLGLKPPGQTPPPAAPPQAPRPPAAPSQPPRGARPPAAPPPQAPPPQAPPKNDLTDAAEAAAKKLRERIAKRQEDRNKPGGEIFSRPADDAPTIEVNDEDLEDLSTMGAERILAGGVKFEDWSNQMMNAAGDLVKAVAEDSNASPSQLLRFVHDYAREIAKAYGVEAEETPTDADVSDDAVDRLALEQQLTDKSEREDTEAYVNYQPTIKGKPHPGNIVETKTMATVPLPEITYRPALPAGVDISNVQMEAVAIAGQQNDIILPGGFRASALIGDGTGLGKGRIAAAIAFDNWNQGRKRIVFVSKKVDLMQDFARDLSGIGAAPDLLKNVSKNAAGQYVFSHKNSQFKPLSEWKGGQKVKHEGIVFASYNIITGVDSKGNRRIDQLEEYLRGDDGGEGAYIIFDESHKLKNAIAAGRGKPSKSGANVLGLMEHLPPLRSVSLSATAATDVTNLGYLTRLGIWGPGTSFPGGFGQFMQEVGTGRLSAMELIARELKALGKYVSRTLSFKGVTFDEEEHQITADQKAMFRTAASAWRTVRDSALSSIANTTNGGRQAVSAFNSAFYGTQLRFFDILITTLKIPTVVRLAEKALADNKSVVITVINTGEAAQEREKNKARDDDDDEDAGPPEYDFGPKEMLVNLVEQHYPTQQFRDDVDANGNAIKVPMYRTDPDTGRTVPVVNPTAIAARDALVARIRQDLHMPANPLDVLIDSLGGGKAVGEISGRAQKYDSSTGQFVSRGAPGTRRQDLNVVEMANFQGGKKRVVVVTSAGDTGISLHAGEDAVNQQPRYHITLQMGYKADAAMQMLGRTHRSGEIHPPEYMMVVSDLGGEKRFIATISRRLGSLGALSKGQKNAIGGSSMMDKVNFETDQGRAAVTGFYTALQRNVTVPGAWVGQRELTGMEVLQDLGVLRTRPDGSIGVPAADMTNVTKLLNRLMALDPDVQNAVYNFYYDIFEAQVQAAIENGTLDTGVKSIPGDEFRIKEQRLIATDPRTGAQTFYYPVEAKLRLQRTSPEDLEKRIAGNLTQNPRLMRNAKGRVLLAIDAAPVVHADGTTSPAVRVIRPGSARWSRQPLNDHTFGFKPVKEWADGDLKTKQDALTKAEKEMKIDETAYADAVTRARSRVVREAEQILARAQNTVRYYESNPTGYDEQRKKDAERAVTEAQVALGEAKAKPIEPDGRYYKEALEESQKEVALLRPAVEEARAIAADPDQWAKDQWAEQYESAPTHAVDEYHLFGGAVMRYWNAIKEASPGLNIYTTVDSTTGQRVVGVSASAGSVNGLLARITGGRATVTTGQLISDVLINGTEFRLEGGIRVRRGRVSKKQVIELLTQNQAVIDNLRSMGVLYERGITSILYVPSDAAVQKRVLDAVLRQYPAVPEGGDEIHARPRDDDDRPAGPTWYSHLEKTIEAKMPAHASANQVAGIVSNPQNGVKADELKWTGLMPWLDEQQSPVSKTDVLDFIRMNGVKVEEVMYGGPDNTNRLKGLLDERDRLARQISEMISTSEDKPWPDGGFTNLQDAEAALSAHNFSAGDNSVADQIRKIVPADLVRQFEKAEIAVKAENTAARENKPKYGKYTLAGGRNYGELLMTLPQKPGKPWEVFRSKDGKPVASFDTGQEARDAAARMGEGYDYNLRKEGWEDPTVYKSSHWSEDENVVAHIRFATRSGADGERILHIEEIQSDWHQEGRNKGYKPTGEEKARLEKEFAEADAAHTKTSDAKHDALELFKYSTPDDDLTPAEFRERNRLNEKLHREHNLPAAEMAEWHRLRDKNLAYEEALADLRDKAKAAVVEAEKANNETWARRSEIDKKLHTGVPAAPFSKTWHELAFRRALRYAAENGFDRVTWTTGKQNADRYNLANHVSKITWTPGTKEAATSWTEAGTMPEGMLQAFDKSGASVFAKAMKPEEIPDYTGKEVAKKLLESAPVIDNPQRGHPYDQAAHALEGENLQVGGQGMNEFYDQILPRYAKKLGSKWGAQVGDVEIKAPVFSPELPSRLVRVFRQEFLEANQTQLYNEADQVQAAMDWDSLSFSDAMSAHGSVQLADKMGVSLVHKKTPQTITVHSMPITPQMHESVMAGQPLFRPRELKDWRDASPETRIESADAQYDIPGPGRGHVLINRPAADIIRDAISHDGYRQRAFKGLMLGAWRVEQLVAQLEWLAKKAETPESALVYKNLLAQIKLASADEPIVTFVDAGPDVDKADAQTTADEEAFHRQQIMATHNSEGRSHVDAEALMQKAPLLREALAKVRKRHGRLTDDQAFIEIGAMLATGQGADLGLSPIQIRGALRSYLEHLEQRHGTVATSQLIEYVRDDLRQALGGKYAISDKQGRKDRGSLYPEAGGSAAPGSGSGTSGPDSQDAKGPGSQGDLFERPRTPGDAGADQDEEAAGATTKSGVASGAAALAREEVIPRVAKLLGGARQIVTTAVNFFAPRVGVPDHILNQIYRMNGGREAAGFLLANKLNKWSAAVNKMTHQQMIDFIDRQKTGVKQETPDLQNLSQFLQETDDALYALIKQYRPTLDYVEHHYRVLWKVIPGSDEAKGLKSGTLKGAFSGAFRRPLQGGKGFLQQHTLKDMSEGLAMGGVPYSYNPLKMYLAHFNDSMKFITAQKLWEDFQTSGVRKFVKKFGSTGPPPAFEKLKDPIAKVYFPVPQGTVDAGDWYVQEGAARMLNNMLGRDYLREVHSDVPISGITGNLGSAMLGIKNATTGIELSFSPFHLVFEAIEAMGSQIGIGGRKVWNLGLRSGIDPKWITNGLKDIVTAPMAPYTMAHAGSRAKTAFGNIEELQKTVAGRKWLNDNPETRENLRYFFIGGGKTTMPEDFQIKSADGFREFWNSAREGNTRHYVPAGLHALPAFNQWIMSPLFDKFIPNLKIAFFLKEFALGKLEYADRLASGEMTLEKLARRTVDSVENRFGEMNFDNLYWDRTFKTFNQILWRSVTWKLGNLRANFSAAWGQGEEFHRAFRDKKLPLLDMNMGWFLGMTLATVILGSLIHKAGTGKWPASPKDVLYPVIDDAAKIRVSLQTYWRDLMHLEHDPEGYAKSSLSGEIGRFADVWDNKDFYGNEVYNPDDPLVQRTMDKTFHMIPLPFNLSSQRAAQGQGGNLASKVAGYLGFTKAPHYIEETNAEQLAWKYYNDGHRPPGSRNAYQAGRNQAMRGIRNIYRRKGNADAEIKQAESKGFITPGDVTKLRNQSRESDLAGIMKSLSMPEALKVYDKATPEERKGIDREVRNKVFAAVRKPGEWGKPGNETRVLAKKYFRVAPPVSANFGDPGPLQ